MKRTFLQLLIGSALLAVPNTGWADDDSKNENKKEVIIVQKWSADTLENVKSALDKANIADDVKAEVLKKLEVAMKNSEKSSSDSTSGDKKSARIEISRSKSDPNDQQDVKVTIVDGDEDKPSLRTRSLGNLQGLSGKMQTQVLRPFAAKDSFRIGVVCQQASDETEEEGKTKSVNGLRIESVIDESPAAEAGIKKGDVLVMVNGKPLSAIKDLTDAIQEAGKREKDVNLEISRDDKKISYQVKPKKMKTSDLEMDNVNLLNLPSEGFVVDEESMKRWQEFASKFKGAGQPPVAFSFSGNEELKKEIEQLKAEISDLKKMIRELTEKK